MDDLNAAKSAALGEARNLMVGRMSFEFYFDFFEMLKSNNELMSAGYFITDENREQKYLEIVNSDNADLLNLLKKYLEVYDRINAHIFHYGHYQKLKQALDGITSLEQATQMLGEFRALFT